MRELKHALDECEMKVMEIIENPIPLNMTPRAERKFQEMETCHICESPFELYDEKKIKVRDHCHLTGRFLGAAHQSCNLNRKIVPEYFKVPVYTHNFTGYIIYNTRYTI